jgi:hypothetical protein
MPKFVGGPGLQTAVEINQSGPTKHYPDPPASLVDMVECCYYKILA